MSFCTSTYLTAAVFIFGVAVGTANAGDRVKISDEQLKESLAEGRVIAGLNTTTGAVWMRTNLKDGNSVLDWISKASSGSTLAKTYIETGNRCFDYIHWGKQCFETFDVGNGWFENVNLTNGQKSRWFVVKSATGKESELIEKDKRKLKAADLTKRNETPLLLAGLNLAKGTTFLTNTLADGSRLTVSRAGMSVYKDQGTPSVEDDNGCSTYSSWGKLCAEIYDLGDGWFENVNLKNGESSVWKSLSK